MTFQNHVVWITGASSGIGLELAKQFAGLGATVAISARRMDLLENAAAEIEAAGGKAKAFYCDVLKGESIEQCVQQVAESFGRIDVAIANAGFGVMGKIEDMTEAGWARQLAGNVTGLALTAKYVLPYLRKNQGRLVLIGSVGAFLPGPGIGAYGASKAAVHSIGETLQVELMGSGVSCTTIHPGFVDSNIARIDNEGNFHPDRQDPRPGNLMWTTEKAASVMIKAIAKRRKVFVFTGHGKVAVFLGKYLPGAARKMMAKSK